LLNPELKQQILSLQLSNDGTSGQIQSFLSLFPLNEFVHLESLSLIDLEENNVEQLLPMFPLLSNLYSFSFSKLKSQVLKLISTLSNSKLRILSVTQFDFPSTILYETLGITSLTIVNGNLNDLFQILKYAPLLKYFKIEDITNCQLTNIVNGNGFYLKELIIDNCKSTFRDLELLLKRTPNLSRFSICTLENDDMLDAIRWQNLIESSLKYLSNFKFYFRYFFFNKFDENLRIFKQFQTDFWLKEHHWNINYEIDHFESSIYTIPFLRNQYRLTTNTNIYRNSFKDYSNGFNNIKILSFMRRAIKDNSIYYFRNVQSLILIDQQGYYDGNQLKIQHLRKIINLSNIKHLTIDDDSWLRSSSFFSLLNQLPYVSSLRIDPDTLMRFFNKIQLRKHLMEKIQKLDISCYLSDGILIPDQIRSTFCQVFSNIEQFKCDYMENLDDLLLLLKHSSKLSIIKVQRISKSIHSWIQINASTLDVYLDFQLILNETFS
jgi:hypothetical protein